MLRPAQPKGQRSADRPNCGLNSKTRAYGASVGKLQIFGGLE